MIVNYEDTMREISIRLNNCSCDVLKINGGGCLIVYPTSDKDFAKLCDLMVETQGSVDIPFRCKTLVDGTQYTIKQWEITQVEKVKELDTCRVLYTIKIYGVSYEEEIKNKYEDGKVYPISVFDDGELVELENEGYSVEVVTYNPIQVRLYAPKKCQDCNHCYYVFRHLCKLKPDSNNTINPNDTSCFFFEEKKTCNDCEGYCSPKHPDSLGACRKHEFRSCSCDSERCYDFVDKHTYFQCKHYCGEGDGENEFCFCENTIGILCSTQSTCPHFEKMYVPSKKD